MCCGHFARCFCQIPPPQFMNLLYFTQKKNFRRCNEPETKWYDNATRCKDDIYLISRLALTKTDKWPKDTKDKETALISILPFWIRYLILAWWRSIFSASLRRALLVDALCETSSLDKPTHHVKVGYTEG